MCANDISRPRGGPSLSRRSFLVNASGAVGGLVLGFNLPVNRRALAAAVESEIHAYVRIGIDETVTITYGGSELGQGTMSGTAQILAEELKARWDDVVIEQAPYSGSGLRYRGSAVSYFTAGSSAIRRQHDQLRKAGAAAREMLIAAGVARAGASSTAGWWAEDGMVNGPAGESFTFGELAEEAALLDIPANPPLTDRADFTLIGERLPRKDIPLKVNGRAIYGIDVNLGPDMLYASVKHCPVFGGTMRRMPRKPSGAIAVVPLAAPQTRGATTAGDINAVAVVTDGNTWKAMQAAKRLSVSWNIPAESADMDDAVIRLQAEDLMADGESWPAEDPIGDVEGALSEAVASIDSTYYLPYVSHVCMEVLNCTVDYRGDSCEIWCPVQAASWVLSEAVTLTGLPAEQITVHTTFLGGGLGRKIERDYFSQAIQVGMAVEAPVKVVWTREEDTRFDQYRPMALINVKAGVDQYGDVAWDYRHVSPSISRQRGRYTDRSGNVIADGQATEGQYGLPYDFATSRSEWVEHTSKVPVGYWRSVGHSLNAFAVESAIDELAYAAVRDPMEFRKELMAAHPRALAVVEAADAASQWRHSLPGDRAWGMAFAEAFGSLCCQVAEVSGTDTALRVHRVTCVVDCGSVINPGSVEMQMQSGIIHGLNAALWGGQSFVAGAPQVANFNNLRMLRVKEAPTVDVHVVESGEALGGIGEPGVPPIAPAVANAYFRLTGIRVRSLPFFPDGGGMADGGGPGGSGGGGGGTTTPSGPLVEFQGTISAVGADYVVVSGVKIIITSSTQVNVHGGKLKVGQQAQGKGWKQANGDIIASSIEAE